MRDNITTAELAKKEEISKKYWESLGLSSEKRAEISNDYLSSDRYEKNTISFSIDSDINDKVISITKNNDFPLYSIFLSGLIIELYRYTGKEEQILGIPMYITNMMYNSHTKNTVLPFVNTLNIDMKVKNLIMETRDKILEAYENKDVNLDNILKNLNISNSVMELTSISIALNTLHIEEYVEYICNSCKNQIALCINKKENSALEFTIVYNSSLLKVETMQLFGNRFIKILNEMINNLDSCIKDIEMISEEEKNQILYEFNDTSIEYPKYKGVHELFEEQVERTPDNVAVIYGEDKLTYRELNEKANQLARLLRDKGVKENQVVGIMVERSLELMMGIFGILKARGAYLPIDPNYPEDRIEYLLNNSSTQILLTGKNFKYSIDQKDREIINIKDSLTGSEYSKENLELEQDSERLMYVLYTSGSTGKPKGAMVKCNSFTNLINWFTNEFSITCRDNILLMASVSFDLAQKNLYGALIKGGKLTILKSNAIEYNEVTDTIERECITIINCTPSAFHPLLEVNADTNYKKLKSLRNIFLGGEPINVKKLEPWVCSQEYNAEIINTYGPTECTDIAAFYRIKNSEICGNNMSVPIGKSIDNTRLYILDKNRKILPVGIAGELYIGGIGVSKGYYNEEGLTRDNFIKCEGIPEEILYKTGDLVKWMPDGNIEFLGRIDHQVKIRGNRIELGEIESRLLSHEAIQEAVVVAKGDADKFLCAYIVSQYEVKSAELREYLGEALPKYMIPSYFVQLEKLPLTPNGKIDKKALPEPDKIMGKGLEYEAPRNDVEEKLAQVWSEVLGVEGVGINDNFFDLGGDSIKAIRIASKLQKYGYKLEVSQIFDDGVIKRLSNKVKNNQSNIDQDIIQGEVKLTPIQRMFFEQNFSHMHHWNQAVMVYKKDGFEEEIVRNVFEKILIHHDALRMIYKKEGEKIVQINRGVDDKLFDLKIFDYSSEVNYKEVIEKECTTLQSSIDLENGPLVKLGLFKTGEGNHLLIAIHHLVIDGVSWRILLEDFTEGYKAFSIGEELRFQEKTNSFKDWADCLHGKVNCDKLQEEYSYWDGIESAEIKVFPVDRECGEDENKLEFYSFINLELSEKETGELLKNTNRAYNTEINDLLVAALGVSINEWTLQEEILIDLEGHGRETLNEDIDISRTIGWFTVHYPVLLKIKNRADISYTVKSVKETLRCVPNKGIGYGMLKYLEGKKHWNNKEPEISFNYLGQFNEASNNEIFEMSYLSTGKSMSPNGHGVYKLEINGMELEGKLRFTISYNSKVYNEATISKFGELFKKKILEIKEHCKNRKSVELTPSDFSDKTLTLEELEYLKDKYEINSNIIIDNIYSLTPMQEGMLFHALMDNKSTAYFEQIAFSIKGRMDIEIIQESFNKLIEVYDVLRTVIVHKNLESPKQVVFKSRTKDVYYKDLTKLNKDVAQDYIKEFEIMDRKNLFDLSEDTLIRLSILRFDAEEYKMVWDSHHILLDGWSLWIVMRDFFEIYSSLKNNREVKIKEPKQYIAYINWLNEQSKNKAKLYWEKYLQDYSTIADIPLKNAKNTKEYINKELKFSIGKSLTHKLKNISQTTQVTLNTIIQAVWGILLQKYNNSEDVVFGSVVSGRNVKIDNIDEMVGLFINTIPVRVMTDNDSGFSDVLRDIQKGCLESNNYAYYPLADIQALTDAKTKLINNKITFQNYYIDENLRNMNFSSELGFIIDDFNGFEQTNYDFNIKVIPDEELTIIFLYNASVYDDKCINTIKKHFNKIIESVVEDSKIRISQIEMISKEEKNQILYEFNNTKEDYQRDKTIHKLFEECVERNPNATAVVFGDNILTYSELNEKANQLARLLRSKGVQADTIVGLMFESSIEMIIGIMAILKSGGAYLPIEPTHPKDRIEYMLKDADVRILVTSKDLERKLDFNGDIIDVTEKSIFKGDKGNLEGICKSDNLVYVIYTSGTTGNSKGVMVSHYSLVNYCTSISQKASIGLDDETALLSSYAYDLGYTTLFTALTNGIKLNMFDEENYKDPKKLIKHLENVTYVKMTPSLFSMLVNNENIENIFKNSKLRLIVLGGESINVKDISKFSSMDRENRIRIMNHYGPTESTVGCLATMIDKNKIEDYENVIGKPLNNIRVYVLDKFNRLLPVGVPGELCIAGDGLAKGYLSRPELTENKFVESIVKPGERIYKTGDMVKWLPGGEIKFLGRMDNQIKIRGYRVELGEIENKLLSYENIKEAVVLVKEKENNEKILCAYIVARDKLVETSEIRDYLKKSLPDYMIPSFIMQIEKMVLTPNGKVNRKALPEPDIHGLVTAEYEAPRDDFEEKLAQIYSEVLGVGKVGINDNFFELGGHSLKATVLISKIHKNLDIELPLKFLFDNPTIKEIRKYIEASRVNIYETIEKCREKEFYEISAAQRRMYMVQQLEKGTVYNMPIMFKLEGNIDPVKIEAAFNKLVKRHDALRTYFEDMNGEIIQRIDNDYKFSMGVRKEKDKGIEELAKLFVRPFSLKELPLFRVELVEINDQIYLLVDMHHIISDAVSLVVLVSEFIELHNGINLEPLRLQYKDFAMWQNKFLRSVEMKKQEEYWISKFKDDIPVLSLPYDFERPILQSFEGNTIKFSIDEKITKSLRDLARETGSTLHMVGLAAFNILLSKYSGQEDIVVGVPVAGRPHADLQNIIGVFINTLALRNKIDSGKSLEEFLKVVKENCLNGYENQNYQFEGLIDKLNVKRDTSRNPLFDVMFNMVNVGYEKNLESCGLVLKPIITESKVSKFDLTLRMEENNQTIDFSFEYCTKLFMEETIERLGRNYIHLLDFICKNRKVIISEIEVMTEKEKNQILFDFNNTRLDYPRDKTIYELFEEQVEKAPDNIAVVFDDKKLTYKELNEKSNRLARSLRNKGVQSESIVGIMVFRSIEMIVGVMGILKSGAAYLPIDPEHPKERIEYMLEDAQIDILVTSGEACSNIKFDGSIMDIKDESINSFDGSNLGVVNKCSDLSYVIYTSGSTGKPKGVMIEHRQVSNFIYSIVKETSLTQCDSILCITTISFDIFGLETLVPLARGLKVVVAREDESIDGEKLGKLIEKNSVEVIQTTPSRFRMLLASNNFKVALKKMKVLLVGGEELPLVLMNELNQYKNLKAYNVYGPTETTIWSTAKLIEGKNRVTIGKPIGNTKIYIMDNTKQLVPIGVNGELCIGGDGVARGYLKRNELTRERFVDNPYETEGRIYKTGDLARWLPDGNIEFSGRLDNQVKIRGFRIELGEIESRLLGYKNIKEAVVVARAEEDNQKYLCAYLVGNEEIDKSQIKEYLKESLPEYMVPAYFIYLNQMPLTPNGKIDRKALPKPDIGDVVTCEYQAPRNEVEQKLAELWCEILRLEKVGINDDFFELGGHSLKATILISKIHKKLNVELPLVELFSRPTIKEISSFISNNSKNKFETIDKCVEKEYYETSSVQKRIYSLQQLDKNSTAYNMPSLIELEGEIDFTRIEAVFKKLVQRHEALRTYFETNDGEIVQKIEKKYEFKLEIKQEKQKGIKDIVKNFVRSFSLEKAPLFRVKLVEFNCKTYLLTDIHHIITDGISMNILIKEFAALYNGLNLEPLRLQYRDFAQWQNKFINSDKMKKQKEYWVNEFSDDVPALNLPYDYERTAEQNFEGKKLSFSIDEETTERLRNISKETGSTIHMVLLAAYYVLLYKYSGQEDIVVGLPIAGRTHAELENIMGMFVNTLALRNKPNSEKTFKVFLAEVKKNSLMAYENQDCQFEDLIGIVNAKREVGRNPLFDVMFDMINSDFDTAIELNGITLKPCLIENEVSKFDLTLKAVETSNNIGMCFEYSSRLFRKETIIRAIEDLKVIIDIISKDYEIPIGKINVLNSVEQEHILKIEKEVANLRNSGFDF